MTRLRRLLSCQCLLCQSYKVGTMQPGHAINSLLLHFWAEFCTTLWLSPLWRVVCLTGFHAFPVLLADEDGQPIVCVYCGKTLNYTEPMSEWAEIGEVKL